MFITITCVLNTTYIPYFYLKIMILYYYYMPTAHTTRILGSTGVIGSSTLWWISYHQRPYKPPKQQQAPSYIENTQPFSSESIDQTIRRGAW